MIVEAKRLNDQCSKSINLAGVNLADPALSELALQNILQNIERAREYSASGRLKEEYEELQELLTKFSNIACESEIHIILGAYRSQYGQAFLVNPCSAASGDPDDALVSYSQSIRNSSFVGCVLKSFYLSSILGISSLNGHDLFNQVLNDEKYPRLDWFTKFAKRIHFDPVRAIKFVFVLKYVNISNAPVDWTRCHFKRGKFQENNLLP